MNAKPDALSYQFTNDEADSSPEILLTASCVVVLARWTLLDDI